jgi:hypothetical protein
LGFELLQRDYPNSEWTKKAQVYALIPWRQPSPPCLPAPIPHYQ